MTAPIDELALRRQLRATIAVGAARAHAVRDTIRSLRRTAATLGEPCLCGEAVEDHTDDQLCHCALALRWAP